jgi:hypothetical protein
MGRGRTLVVVAAALIAGLTAALVAAAFATGGKRSDPRFDRVSNQGIPRADVSTTDADVLRRGGGRPQLNLLAERDGFAFYSAPAQSGGTCYAVGAVTTRRLGVLFCPNEGSVFPSAAMPILNMSGQVFDGEGAVFLGLSGFAADGVAKVGLVDVTGELHAADAVDNVYARRDLPRRRARALVAFDSDGNEIFRRDLSPR